MCKRLSELTVTVFQLQTRASTRRHGCCCPSRRAGMHHRSSATSRLVAFPFPHSCAYFFAEHSLGSLTRVLRVVLAVSCLTFLTTIWGTGVAFTWYAEFVSYQNISFSLLIHRFTNVTGISALLTWIRCGTALRQGTRPELILFHYTASASSISASVWPSRRKADPCPTSPSALHFSPTCQSSPSSSARACLPLRVGPPPPTT